jgi:hypothetical protein
MSFVRNYYPILLEGLLFVCILSFFEYLLYYIVLAPDNKKAIQGKLEKDVKKAITFINLGTQTDDIKQYFTDNPFLAKLVLDFIETKETNTGSTGSTDLSDNIFKKTGYRYYLQQLDEQMENENKMRKNGVTILIFILCLLMIIFILYGRYIIQVNFDMRVIMSAIAFTFVLIVLMQLYFIYRVSPQLKLFNNGSIQRAIYGFMLGKEDITPK